MSTAGLQSLGGGAGLGRGGLDRQLRIVPSTRAILAVTLSQLPLCVTKALHYISTCFLSEDPALPLAHMLNVHSAMFLVTPNERCYI